MARKGSKILFGNQKVLGRNKSYFEEVYRAYFDRLFGFALVITKSESLAKDAVSEVFFKILSIDSFEFSTYSHILFKIVAERLAWFLL